MKRLDPSENGRNFGRFYTNIHRSRYSPFNAPPLPTKWPLHEPESEPEPGAESPAGDSPATPSSALSTTVSKDEIGEEISLLEAQAREEASALGAEDAAALKIQVRGTHSTH